MSAKFDHFGRRIPTTSILAGPNVVLKATDEVAQIGFGQKKKVKKTENAFVSSVGFSPRHIREVKIKDPSQKEGLKIGSQITVSVFSPGDLVKITGVTKGKGFAGGIKRWGFHGGPKTHGQSDRHRAIGSIGQTTTPGRVFKGKKMPGHMGAVNLTVGGLEVIEADSSQNLLIVKGAVPGARNGILLIQKTGRAKNYSPPPEPKAVDEDEEAKNADKTQETKEEVKTSDANPNVDNNKQEAKPEESVGKEESASKEN